ncbi:hypothetical protein F5B20DRAFT_520188 [Whalleya microplaca]|nr:hypothetical protein F5B20DRAFT_520188 [Whalleya microplaca]
MKVPRPFFTPLSMPAAPCHSHIPASYSNCLQRTMCSSVLFIYCCGCTERTVFECSTTGYRSSICQLCECLATLLDEECHDCSSQRHGAGLGLGVSGPLTDESSVLRERSLNKPAKVPPRISLSGSF